MGNFLFDVQFQKGWIMEEILRPGHERWTAFIQQLEKECMVTGSRTGLCDGLPSRSFTTEILSGLKGIDVEGSLEYFSECGGCCDCRVFHFVEKKK
jgi:hypothetical protein